MENKINIEMLENKTKITKKEYYNLIKDNIFYNIGTNWINSKTKEYQINNIELINKLNENFLNIEYLEKYCVKCHGSNKNSIDFLHNCIKNIDNVPCILHENKKGNFYKIELENNLILILHEYKDTTNTISYKVILNNWKC